MNETERFLHLAAQTVARHGVSRGFYRDGQTHAGMRESVGLDAKGEESIVDAAATGIDRIELQLAAQTKFCAKS